MQKEAELETTVAVETGMGVWLWWIKECVVVRQGCQGGMQCLGAHVGSAPKCAGQLLDHSGSEQQQNT